MRGKQKNSCQADSIFKLLSFDWVVKKKLISEKWLKNATLNMKIVYKNNCTLLFWWRPYRKYSVIFICLWNERKRWLDGITIIQFLCFLKVEVYNKIGIQFGPCSKIIPSSLKMLSYLNLSLRYHLTSKKYFW